jgi:serine/threonine protein kinase
VADWSTTYAGRRYRYTPDSAGNIEDVFVASRGPKVLVRANPSTGEVACVERAGGGSLTEAEARAAIDWARSTVFAFIKAGATPKPASRGDCDFAFFDVDGKRRELVLQEVQPETGYLGYVTKAREPATGETFAVKRVRKDKLHSHAGMLKTEADRMREVSARVRRLPKFIGYAELEVAPRRYEPALVMEYVEGECVEAMRKEKPFSIAMAVRTMLEALETLAEVHDAGFIFCDFHPGQFMMQRGLPETMKVIDYGNCKRIDEVLKGGNSVYRAPEQDRPEGTSGSVAPDIFAAALSTVTLITGDERKLRDVDWSKIPNEDLIAVLKKSLSADPRERHASARALADALRPFASLG